MPAQPAGPQNPPMPHMAGHQHRDNHMQPFWESNLSSGPPQHGGPGRAVLMQQVAPSFEARPSMATPSPLHAQSLAHMLPPPGQQQPWQLPMHSMPSNQAHASATTSIPGAIQPRAQSAHVAQPASHQAKRPRLSPVHERQDLSRSSTMLGHVMRVPGPTVPGQFQQANLQNARHVSSAGSAQSEAAATGMKNSAAAAGGLRASSAPGYGHRHPTAPLTRPMGSSNEPARRSAPNDGAPEGPKGARPGFLQELAAELGVIKPFSLPKCPPFVAHRPNNSSSTALTAVLTGPARQRSCGQAPRLQHEASDTGPPNIAPGMFVTAGSRNPAIPQKALQAEAVQPAGRLARPAMQLSSNHLLQPDQTADISPGRNRQPEAASKGALNNAPDIIGTAVNHKHASSTDELHADAGLSTAIKHALENVPDLSRSTGGHSRAEVGIIGPEGASAPLESALDVVPGRSVTAGSGQPIAQPSAGPLGMDCAPDIAPGAFVMAGTKQPFAQPVAGPAAMDCVPHIAPGAFVMAGSRQPIAQPSRNLTRDGRLGGTPSARLGRRWTPGLSHVSASRSRFLADFAAELGNLGADEAPASVPDGHPPVLHPSAAAAAAAPPLHAAAILGPAEHQRLSLGRHPCLPTLLGTTTMNFDQGPIPADSQHSDHPAVAGAQTDGDGAPRGSHQQEARSLDWRTSLDQGVLAGLLDTQPSGPRWSGSGAQLAQIPNADSSVPQLAGKQAPTPLILPDAAGDHQWPARLPASPVRHAGAQWQQSPDRASNGQPEHGQLQAASFAPQLKTAAGEAVHINPANLQQAHMLLEGTSDGTGRPTSEAPQTPATTLPTADGPQEAVKGLPGNLAGRMVKGAATQQQDTSPVPAALWHRLADDDRVSKTPPSFQQDCSLSGDGPAHDPAARNLLGMHDPANMPAAALTDADAPAADPSANIMQLRTAAGATVRIDPARMQQARRLLGDNAGTHAAGDEQPDIHDQPTAPCATSTNELSPSGVLHSDESAEIPVPSVDDATSVADDCSGSQAPIHAARAVHIDPAQLQQARRLPQTIPGPPSMSDGLAIDQSQGSMHLSEGPAGALVSDSSPEESRCSDAQQPINELATSSQPLAVSTAQTELGHRPPQVAAVLRTSPSLPTDLRDTAGLDAGLLAANPASSGISLLRTAAGKAIQINPASLRQAQMLFAEMPPNQLEAPVPANVEVHPHEAASAETKQHSVSVDCSELSLPFTAAGKEDAANRQPRTAPTASARRPGLQNITNQGPHGAQQASRLQMAGLQTAGGLAISLDPARLDRACMLLQEPAAGPAPLSQVDLAAGGMDSPPAPVQTDVGPSDEHHAAGQNLTNLEEQASLLDGLPDAGNIRHLQCA